MTGVREYFITEELVLDHVVLKKGEKVTAKKSKDGTYTIFHHTGWWKVDKKHFESNINK